MEEKKFLEIVEALCKSPQMYTNTGSFYEAISFLEGFALGANVGNNSSHSKFTPFHKWLNQKFDSSISTINCNNFREQFSTDSVALEKLGTLYKEFVESSKN